MLPSGPGDIACSMPNMITFDSGSTESTRVSDRTSQSRPVQIDGMDVIDRQMQEKGFSENSRKLFRAAWRKGTRKDYNSKFRVFHSWCCARKVEPYAASLVYVSEFLTYLFEKGLQFHTIAGYRSMLSVILSPVDGFKVGQHPDILLLIKGVFNSRPPKKRLVSKWDLSVVLKALQKEPFEPLRKVSSKYLTYKTAFLIAVTCFRRCSNLQSLRLG